MELWPLFWAVVGAGGAGGVLNAFLSENGFPLPRKEEGVWRPGFIGNVVIGAAAAFVSWGLYGPYASAAIVGTDALPSDQSVFLTLSALTGAFVVGIGGARFLSSEVDKKLLTLTASRVASSDADAKVAAEIAAASPVDAARIARQMSR